jgi:hypothetical protein
MNGEKINRRLKTAKLKRWGEKGNCTENNPNKYKTQISFSIILLCGCWGTLGAT